MTVPRRCLGVGLVGPVATVICLCALAVSLSAAASTTPAANAAYRYDRAAQSAQSAQASAPQVTGRLGAPSATDGAQRSERVRVGAFLAAKSGSELVEQTAKDIRTWVGQDARLIRNEAGDTILVSKNGTRRVRFDVHRPYPHQSPHAHVEELVNGKWKKSGPIYPVDVPKR